MAGEIRRMLVKIPHETPSDVPLLTPTHSGSLAGEGSGVVVVTAATTNY